MMAVFWVLLIAVLLLWLGRRRDAAVVDGGEDDGGFVDAGAPGSSVRADGGAAPDIP